ncbi:MAG: AAA family ATPase, partial [Acetobacter persici]
MDSAPLSVLERIASALDRLSPPPPSRDGVAQAAAFV